MGKMKILVINGPNLNMLGIREKRVYGQQSYEELIVMIRKFCEQEKIEVFFFQSNHEGAMIDTIQSAYGVMDGIVINPGAYTHTSIALMDAIAAVSIPTVEVHISNIYDREPFRQVSYISLVAQKAVIGHGFDGYIEAIQYLQTLHSD